ncbi:hypothetical protein PtA15_1A4 [Puccinia triticina]|uniref:Uncharacterized protein n=1 Tax=Puccinia triticina TaxID=208348 RepID=A0ABY7C942_9BASI|nr:uncharacterized protein PtA15_1A4 [Puccinia triticina]WAQ80666.1 hypothetical protein PtA15_1A4 [Puccinia triticina]
MSKRHVRWLQPIGRCADLISTQLAQSHRRPLLLALICKSSSSRLMQSAGHCPGHDQPIIHQRSASGITR